MFIAVVTTSRLVRLSWLMEIVCVNGHSRLAIAAKSFFHGERAKVGRHKLRRV